MATRIDTAQRPIVMVKDARIRPMMGPGSPRWPDAYHYLCTGTVAFGNRNKLPTDRGNHPSWAMLEEYRDYCNRNIFKSKNLSVE